MKGFKGMPGNIQGMMQQAQKLQEDLKRAQLESESITAEAQAGGGIVKAVANGKNKLVSLTISKDAANPDDLEFLEHTVLSVVNDALAAVQDKVAEKMKAATGGIQIPGLF